MMARTVVAPTVEDGSAPEERHRPPRLSLLREIKIDSPVHRLAPEVKFLSILGISLTASYFPSWGTIGLFAGLLLVATLLARVPAGALPRPPRAFWIVVLISGALASASGGAPHVTVDGLKMGFGAADAFVKFVSIGALLLWGALVIGWTTSLGDVAPAVSRLLTPLRWVRLPADEWAVTLSLCIRSFPLMMTEMRTLVAARRLRPRRPLGPDEANVEGLLRELVDIMVAALAVSVRRAGELADAIVARGGTGLIAAGRRRLDRSDYLTLFLVLIACIGASQIPVPS